MDQPASTNLFKELFFRDLSECNGSNPKSTTYSYFYIVNNPDTIIEYTLNNYKARGEDFKETAEIVTLGCSQTYGEALPQNYIWPEVFSNITNKKVHNLAQRGDSVQGQVFKAFKYFKEIGNPKVILGLFPSSRVEMPTIGGIFEDTSRKNSLIKEKKYIQTVFLKNAEEPVKYSKLPHNPVEVIPEEVGLFYSFTFIQMLEQYCKDRNIMLLWTFWDDEWFIDYVKENAQEALINYIDHNKILINFQVECLNGKDISLYKENPIELNLTCHQDNKDILNHPLYSHAADCNHETNTPGHFGIHAHLHVADMFYEEYLKRIKQIK
jgi:hypothetical protein